MEHKKPRTEEEYRAQILEAILDDYPDACWQRSAIINAAALLREHEPHILTASEVKARLDRHKTLLTAADPLFIQFRPGYLNDHDEALIPRWRDGVNQRTMLINGNYGKSFVFWTGRPTEDQMREVAWP